MPLNATERPTGKRKEIQGIIETSHHGVSFLYTRCPLTSARKPADRIGAGNAVITDENNKRKYRQELANNDITAK